MALLHISGLSLSTASATLFESVDAQLLPGMRVGLVGPNGSGKSTLLRVLARCAEEEDPTDSYWVMKSGRVDGLLSPQKRSLGSALLVHQDTLSWASLLPGAGTEEEIRELTLTDALDLCIIADDKEETSALEDAEAWRRLSVSADKVLCWNLAGYQNTPIGQLSPGSALRAYLAIAIQRSDIRLLFLDEPTNHLDLPSILWLQRALLSAEKAAIIVSHDERFLDAVCNCVWEIDNTTRSITVSAAQFSAYRAAKLQALEKQKRDYEQQQKRHTRLTKAADKLRDQSLKGAKFQSKDHDTLQRDFKRDRAGRSGKKAAAVEKLRDSEEKMERVVERPPLQIRLDPVSASGDATLSLNAVQLGYVETESSASDTAAVELKCTTTSLPLPPVTLRVDYGERIAIVGFNAVGKSTLLRTLMGELPAVSGDVHLGRDLRVGNLTQEHASLPRNKLVREHVADVTKLDPFHAGNHIIRYGLTLHQVNSKVGELNPGARARLLLATFAMRKVNCLILDEPTNHLDEEAMGELSATLNSYAGSVVLVSHDRQFLDSLKLNATYLLSPKGLSRIESVADFAAEVDALVDNVISTGAVGLGV